MFIHLPLSLLLPHSAHSIRTPISRSGRPLRYIFPNGIRRAAPQNGQLVGRCCQVQLRINSPGNLHEILGE
jgi:hypothetical protein